MSHTKTGLIVWHDLFTRNRPQSMAFYQALASWHYITEHATSFAWGGGAQDFVLALLDDEAGAGMAETPDGLPHGWIAYIEVDDVETTAARAEHHGGTIIRPAFDVPGVGRNALLRDPSGAVLGISKSAHSYPVPTRQFGPDLYLPKDQSFPHRFYAETLGWTCETTTTDDHPLEIKSPQGTLVARHMNPAEPPDASACFIPGIRVKDTASALHAAKDLGATSVGMANPQSDTHTVALLRDPTGTLFGLINDL